MWPTPGNILLKVAGDGQRGTERLPHGEGRGRVDVDDNVRVPTFSTSSSLPGGGYPCQGSRPEEDARDAQEGQRQARRHDNAGWPRAPAASSMTRCSVCVRAQVAVVEETLSPSLSRQRSAILAPSSSDVGYLRAGYPLPTLLPSTPSPTPLLRPCFAARFSFSLSPARISPIGREEERNAEGEG